MKDQTLKKILLPILGIIAIAATGCSGATSNSATPVAAAVPTTGYPVAQPPGTTTSPASKASAVFKITVPNASSTTASNARHPQYISTATQSVQISLTSVNSASYSLIAPVVANLTPGSQNCSGSPLVCTVSFPSLPLGTDGFTVNTYDATSATGNVLSTATATAQIAVATMTNVPFTLQGIIKTLAVSVNSTLVPGTASTDAVTVTADDAAGAQIIGSAPFQNGPIAVTTDDALGSVVVTSALSSIASPGNTSFAYDGTSIANNAEHIIATDGTITASGPIPVATSTATLAQVGLPIDAAFSGSNPYAESSGTDSVLVVKATEIGWGSALSHPFTVTNNCGANVVVTNPSTDTFKLTSGGTTAVSCIVTIIGGGASSDVINVSQAAGKNGANVQLQSTK